MIENKNIYVGNRYVPKIMGEWNKQETYEGLSIVTLEGTSYTSKKGVPIGIDLSNEEYWVVTGNYNAQIENYRNETVLNTNTISKVKNDLSKTGFIANTIQELISFATTSDNRSIIIGSPLTLLTNLQIPKNIRLLFRNNGMITIKSGITLTLDCYIDAEHYQIFSFEDDTSIITTSLMGIYGETTQSTNIKQTIKLAWFGAKGNGVPPLGTVIGTNLPTGTDDTKAIKRAIDFANKCSINGSLTKLKNPMVTVEAQPNATYFVSGDNILGVQKTTYKATYYRFVGNGCQFLHHVLNDSNSFIANAHLMVFPTFEDFSVDIYINSGEKRLGNFFDVDGENQSVIKMFRPSFDRIRISANSEEYGYRNIFKIDGTTMVDNGYVTNGYFATFEKFFYSTNKEAVNWKFEKNYIHPTTTNGCIYHIENVTSGPFKSSGNEIKLNTEKETYLKTIGESISGGVFELNDRVELNGGIEVVPFDLDYGEVHIKGMNFYAGSGGAGLPKTTSYFAKIGPFATLKIQSCRLPMKEFLIKNIDKTTNNSPREMLIIEDSSIYNNQSSGHPLLTYENSSGTNLTLANVFDSGYEIRKVKVTNSQGNDNVFDYEYGSKKSERKSIMLTHNTGGNGYVDGIKVRIPYNFVIEQIRLTNVSHLIEDVDGVRISLQYATGSEWVSSTTIPLDGNANYGKQLLNNQIITCTHGLALLELQFMKGTQRVTSNIPSFAEIDYRGIARKADFQGDNNGLIRKNIF